MGAYRVTLLFLLPITVVIAQTPMEIRVAKGPYPRVFHTAEEIASAKSRAASQPWAQVILHGIIERAEALSREPLNVPRQGGQWTHWYSCKKDGGSLSPVSPTEHRCNVCGEMYSGWPYDDVYVTQRHSHYLGGLEDLGIAYAMTGNISHAETAKAILLNYAEFYRNLPLHDRDGKAEAKSAARLFAQTLDESVHLCRLVYGYDLVHDAPCFTPDDHSNIERALIRPMVDTIRLNDAGISNWQTWHNAGIAAAGWLLGDASLVDEAFNGPSGVLFQLDKSVLPSGMWYEESPSYHWYALRALLYTFEGAARAGMDVYSHPRARKLFDAPMRQLFPDLTFPALHDSGRSSIADARACYEVAYRRYADEKYASLLEPRDSTWALLWGADMPAEFEPRPLQLTRSSNDRSEGLAILRDPNGESALYLDYGPGKSGHVHPAKLNVIWYVLGDERFVDPGRLPYGNPMHRGWFAQTIAHNTVAVNGTSQQRAGGSLKAFAEEGSFAIARASCTTAYKGVSLDRTVAVVDGIVLDIMLCTAEDESTFDLPLHVRGEFVDLPASAAVEALGENQGYNHLKGVTRFSEPLLQARVKAGQGVIEFRFFDRSQSFYALAPGYELKETVPVVVRRQRGTQAVFAAAYQKVEDGKSKVRVEGRLDLGGATLSVGSTTVTVGEITLVTRTGEGGDMQRHKVTEKGFEPL